MSFSFEGYAICLIEVYYNDLETPSLVKNITWGGYNNSDYIFPILPTYGENLLAITNESELKSDASYILALDNINFDDFNEIAGRECYETENTNFYNRVVLCPPVGSPTPGRPELEHDPFFLRPV
jgi:hypothetical protein